MNVLMRVDLPSYRRRSQRRTKTLQRMVLETYFEAMTRINAAWLKVNPKAPLLYKSGVVYRRDPKRCARPGQCVSELWLDFPSLLKRGAEDCDGLSAALAGELRARAPNSVGDKLRPRATVKLKQTRHPGLWHAVVVDLDTREVFDPSRKLGMGRKRRG